MRYHELIEPIIDGIHRAEQDHDEEVTEGHLAEILLVVSSELAKARSAITKRVSAEQKARDMLERAGVPDAQSYTSGQLVEIANLIAGIKPSDWAQL